MKRETSSLRASQGLKAGRAYWFYNKTGKLVIDLLTGFTFDLKEALFSEESVPIAKVYTTRKGV